MPDVPPPLAHAILDHVAADWPDFALIRPAASSLQSKARLPQAISMAVNELRVALASAALGHGLSAHEANAQRAAQAEARAGRLLMHARAIVSDGARPLMEAWHLSVTQKDLVIGQLASAVGPGGARPRLPSLGADRAPMSGPRAAGLPARRPPLPWRDSPRPRPH